MVSFVRLVAVFLLFGLPVHAQVFRSESFDNEAAASAAWTNGGTNPGPSVWTWTDQPGAGFQDPDLPNFAAPTAAGGYFFFDSNANGLAAHDATLSGPATPFDCSGKTDVRFRFFTQYIYFNSSGTSAELGVSTDGVQFTYHPLFAGLQPNFIYHDWVDLDLDEADGQPKVWLRFRWVGNYEYHWKIDDLQLYTSCALQPGALICDDFETYNTSQRLGPQSVHWTTWSGLEGSDEDGIVSTEKASSPPKSLKIESTDPNGGPQDVVLDLGNRASGRYELRWNMYIPAGKKGYYNIQNTVPVAGGDWNLHVFFDTGDTGDVRLTYNGLPLNRFDFPHDQWFEVRQLLDLDNNLLTLYVNGTFVLKRGYAKSLGGIDFFGLDTQYLFYIDDLAFRSLAPVVYNVDFCDAAVDISQYFGQTPNVLQTTGLFDNSNATVSPSDPVVDCWNEAGGGILNNTLWFTFIGDGDTYDIQTVPCNATHYIGTAQGNKGDTQMLALAGPDCNNLTPVACNEDLFPFGQPDFRAGITLQTGPGLNYYLLVDGFESQGIVASGEFCIQIERKATVLCTEAKVGTFTLDNSGFLCVNEKLTDILSVNNASFVLPNEGPEYGLAWCFSSAPLQQGQWPGSVQGIASTPFWPQVVPPPLLNNGVTLDFGTYYLTPVVLGGGTRINPGSLPYVFNIDPADGCFFVGNSAKVTLLPQLNELSAQVETFDELIPPGNNGALTVTMSGGSGEHLGNPALYHFLWNTGQSTAAPDMLTAGLYTATISDATGCVAPIVVSAQVKAQTVPTLSQGNVQSFQLFPNPSSGEVFLRLSLGQAAEVRLEICNPLGQVLYAENAGLRQTLERPLALHSFADGLYFVRLKAGEQWVQQRIFLQR